MSTVINAWLYMMVLGGTGMLVGGYACDPPIPGWGALAGLALWLVGCLTAVVRAQPAKKRLLPLFRRLFLWAGGEEIRMTRVEGPKTHTVSAVVRIDEHEMRMGRNIPLLFEIADRELLTDCASQVKPFVKIDNYRDYEKDPFALYRRATLTVVKGS